MNISAGKKQRKIGDRAFCLFVKWGHQRHTEIFRGYMPSIRISPYLPSRECVLCYYAISEMLSDFNGTKRNQLFLSMVYRTPGIIVGWNRSKPR